MFELASNDPLIKTYLRDIHHLKRESVSHELGLRGPFQCLLDRAAKKRGWTLIPELSTYSGGKRIVPDGTVRDEFRLARGWWEAKDTSDRLGSEIQKKLKAGYPTRNTIFEDTLTQEDIFHYVYALLHHPGYRERYAANLKRELPRIPFAPDFAAFAVAGKELARLHVEYESLAPWPLQEDETKGVAYSQRVEKMKLSADKLSLQVNESLALRGIPAEVYEYRLGSRSALEWVIDQYQVKGASDPNREDDPGYIVRLIGQVVRVSVDTVKIVQSLPSYL
jgi:predicted helicase